MKRAYVALKPKMTDQKPYLLRAMYEWIVDNDCTPQIVIAHPGKGWVSGVPEQLLREEVLVLNISPTAAPDCVIEDDGVYFTTRFAGVAHQVSVLLPAIASIFARETQEGMGFDVAEDIAEGPQMVPDSTSTDAEKPDKKPTKKASHLKIIK